MTTYTLLHFLETPKALSLELQPIQGILISFTLFHTMPEITKELVIT